MKRFTFTISLLFAIVSSQAQDYLINFAGSGASNTIGSVIVENLTQGKSVTLNGTEALHLVSTITGTSPMMFDIENALRIYPNPMTDKSKIDFVATASGKVAIEFFDIAGKRVVEVQNTLITGTHSFQVSGLQSGIYTMKISAQAYTYTGKLISSSENNSNVKIIYLGGNSEIPITTKKLKSATTEKVMQYTKGDRLKFKGTSGNYSTIITDTPTQSKTITFTFVACTDADGYNYPVVQIGTQTWMAENLAYLPHLNTSGEGTSVSAEYYVYGYYIYLSDDLSGVKQGINYKKYGVLYNWPATKVVGVCPKGWHVPSDIEWNVLVDYLISNGSNYDGTTSGNKIAKSLSSNEEWHSSTEIGSPGNIISRNNSTGFSGLPGGTRSSIGNFGSMNEVASWWSSTGVTSTAIHYSLSINGMALNKSSDYTKNGYSVRCIKD